jgi:hypothetical protein
MGDVFFKPSTLGSSNGGDALVVISQDCDLVPRQSGSKLERVLLLQGSVRSRHLLSKNDFEEKNTKKRTEVFLYSNQDYVIDWDIDNPKIYSLSSLDSTLLNEGYQRFARLRSLYALKLQQLFAANLTRVGTPVSPPFYWRIGVKVF